MHITIKVYNIIIILVTVTVIIVVLLSQTQIDNKYTCHGYIETREKLKLLTQESMNTCILTQGGNKYILTQ